MTGFLDRQLLLSGQTRDIYFSISDSVGMLEALVVSVISMKIDVALSDAAQSHLRMADAAQSHVTIADVLMGRVTLSDVSRD